MSDHYQVTVAASTSDEAERLGRIVVEARLAACAQVSGPITSAYWWDGNLTSAVEWICTLETAAHRLEPLMETLRTAHSYEVPEIIAIPIVAGDPAYLAWIDEETRLDG